MDLGRKDRVALVASSSTGLGKAVAVGLAREGAKLALCARPSSTVRDTGVVVLARAIDVTVARTKHDSCLRK